MAANYGRTPVAFTCNTSAGDQTITIPSGPGKTPKAVVFLISRATALDTITPTAMIGGGMATASVQRGFAAMAEDNQGAATADTGVRADSAHCVEITQVTVQTREAYATFVSFGTDAVTINWPSGNVPVAAYRGVAILYWGDDLSTNLQTIKGSATQDASVNSSSLGFAPDGCDVVSVNLAFTADGGAGEAMLSVGWAGRYPSVTQSCACVCGEDRQSNTSVGVIVRTDAAATQLTSSAGTITEGPRLEFSFGSDTYTVTTRNAAAALEAIVLSYSIGGKKIHAGAEIVDTNTTGDKTISSVGFVGNSILLSTATLAVIDTVVSTQAMLCVGAGSTAETGSVCWSDRDNLATSDSQSYTGTTLIGLIHTGGTSLDVIADLVSFDSGGPRINVSTAGGNDRPIAFSVWEDHTSLRPTGIASTAAVGTPSLTHLLTVSPSGIPSSEAVGTPALALINTLSPTGIASTAAVGTPALTLVTTLSPTGIASAEAVGTPSLTLTLAVSPSGIASSEAVGTPSLAYSLSISPTGIASTAAVGTPDLSTAGSITPTGIASSEAVGTPTLAHSLSVSPTGIASTAAVGTPSLSVFILLSPGGIASTAAVGTPVLAHTLSVAPSGIASTAAVGTPTLSHVLSVSPSGIGSAEAVGTPALSLVLVLSPGGIGSTAAVGTPVLVIAGGTIFDLIELEAGSDALLALDAGRLTTPLLAGGRQVVYDVAGST